MVFSIKSNDMKYFLFSSLLILIACKSSRDMENVQILSVPQEQIVLNFDYEGEPLPAMQLDRLAEAELKIISPNTKIYHQDLLYSPKPGEPGALYKNLPYDGEEIPAIHLDNSTLRNIRNTRGTIVVPPVIEEK